MGRAKFKIFTGIIFLSIWILSIISIKTVKSVLNLSPGEHSFTAISTLLYYNIPLIFMWLLLDVSIALIATVITLLAFVFYFEQSIYIIPSIALILVSYVGFKFKMRTRNMKREYEIQIEKLDEQLNLLPRRVQSEENESLRIRSSLSRIALLKNLIEDYSLTFSEEDIFDSITADVFEIFANANRVLLYLVDVDKQELKLVRSKKRGVPFPIKAKKGDIFDRWTLRHAMPLLVENIHRDFRFSLEEEIDQGFSSLVITPLMSEKKIIGILRIDSSEIGKFTQSDIRLLDIIADLSSVSLENAMLYKKVQDLAIHDSLTGLYVHKYFMEKLHDEIKRSLRHNANLSLLMLDLDNFKDYNDKYGHNVGDLVLKHVGYILKKFINADTFIFRYGGEEFAVLCLNTAKKDALRLSEDIRRQISGMPMVLRRKEMHITVSVGVATCPSEANVAEEFLRLVDSRLYKAKEKGKNTICGD